MYLTCEVVVFLIRKVMQRQLILLPTRCCVEYALGEMGRGHINLHLGIELPKDVGLDIRSRSGFTDKGMEVDVAFIGKNETQVGYMTNVRADIDICLGLVDEDYRNDIGALYRVNSDRYMPTRIANSN